MIKRYNNRRVKSLLQDFDFAGKSTLDFGCGIGSNCYMFECDHYVGVDIDANRIDYAKKLHKNYSFSAIDGESLPFDDRKFDYIFLMAVLHHIPPKQIANYLVEFQRILKPGGKIFVIEPCIFENTPLNNRCMCFFDKGKYIRKEEEYLDLFKKGQYQINNIEKFHKGYIYNEIFFTATS